MANEFPPVAALPQLVLHQSVDKETLDVSKIVGDWLSSFTNGLTRSDSGGNAGLFLEKESWFRDFVALSWNITCENGSEAIGTFLSMSSAGFVEPKIDQPGSLQPQLVEMGGMFFIQSGFSFKTKFGTGKGVLRLASVRPDEWKAWTVFTTLERLVGQDELELSRMKTSEMHAWTSGNRNHELENEEDNDLQVLVVGAGQSGLAVAAQLQNLGLRYLVVDKASQPGDSWTNRYETLRSHTPIYTDHYPFLKYPSNWPRWLDQEHIVKWMGHYGSILRLNIRHNTTVSKVEYDESAQRYSVDLSTRDGMRVVSPKHVVLATGLLSDVPVRPQFPGEDAFIGQVYHTSAHKSAAEIPDLQSKKVTIVGCGTSAHDIAQDYVNRGAKAVTMIQRSPIYSATLSTMEKLQLGLWNTPSISTEEADLMGNSFPTPVVRTLNVGLTQMMAAMDKELLDGMEKAGLALKRGEDGSSFLDHQLIKAGHFYIDQGACKMIVDGRIKIQRCETGVKEYYPGGIILGNGTKVDSDIIVLATGFERGNVLVERIMGQKVMSKVGKIGLLDDSQERIGWWRPTGMPGFWFMTGSFIWSRQFSAVLALQIAAIERGLNKEHFERHGHRDTPLHSSS